MTARLLILIGALLLAACASLQAPPGVNQSIYVLEATADPHPVATKRDLVLAVGTPQARPGFDGDDIAYVQQPYELSYFVTSRWAAAPARMLEPLLIQTLEKSGGFRAVVPAAGPIAADVRLETELVRLQQDFTTRPSRAQLTLRAQLIDVRSHRLLAVKQFDESEASSSENAYGGVVAANRALQRILQQLSDFCLRESVVR